jgi:hypothetical protein
VPSAEAGDSIPAGNSETKIDMYASEDGWTDLVLRQLDRDSGAVIAQNG